MILPQSEAFQSLNDRLTSVCNLRDNLGIKPAIRASSDGSFKSEESSIYKAGLDAVLLLARFDKVMSMHQNAREAIQRMGMHMDKVLIDNEPNNKRNIKTKAHQGISGITGNTAASPIVANTRQRAGIGAVIASGVK